MKRWLLVVLIVALAGASLLTRIGRSICSCSPDKSDGVVAGPTGSSPADGPLEVADLAADPMAHLGPLLLAGTVAQVVPEKSLVVLADSASCDDCDSGCAQVPVRWSGALPAVGSEVVVAGDLSREPKGLALSGTYADDTPQTAPGAGRPGSDEGAGAL